MRLVARASLLLLVVPAASCFDASEAAQRAGLRLGLEAPARPALVTLRVAEPPAPAVAPIAEPEPAAQAAVGDPGDEEDEDASDWGVEPEPIAASSDDEGDSEVDEEASAPLELAAKDGDAPVLASIARETWIYAEPSKKSRRIGYLRAGAIVERAAKTFGTSRCKGGWFGILPRGYVCRNKNATLDRFHPVVEASRTRPSMDGLPYDYVLTRNPPPPLYARVPSEAEQGRSEPGLKHEQRRVAALARDPAYVPPPEPGPMPAALLYGRPAPGLADDKPRAEDVLVLGQARLRSGYALLAHFDHDGRRFGLTTDLAVLPLDRTRWVRPSTFRGLALDDATTLPVGFVMKKKAVRYEADESGRLVQGAALAFREAVPLTGRAHRSGQYLEAKDGTWVRAEDVRRVDPMSRAPTWAKEGRRWIDVSILEQSLVAYEGTRPVYVTLVSTGAGGIQDHKETHATIQGTFLVHTKHVTVTMDGEETGDEFDLRDVPFVQYFTEGYALHGAYWHDDFGTPRSHGCVNLAPLDAAWLFGWTTPEVPEGWHAALSLKKGTVVHTHP